MVRRGSTVRVRQRALQKRRRLAPFVSDLFAVSRTCGRYGALCGAFRSRRGPEEANSANPAPLRRRQRAIAGQYRRPGLGRHQLGEAAGRPAATPQIFAQKRSGLQAARSRRRSYPARRNCLSDARTPVFAVNRAIGGEPLGNADDVAAESCRLDLDRLVFDQSGRFEHTGS
jgi:hypothetical protein